MTTENTPDALETGRDDHHTAEAHDASRSHDASPEPDAERPDGKPDADDPALSPLLAHQRKMLAELKRAKAERDAARAELEAAKAEAERWKSLAQAEVDRVQAERLELAGVLAPRVALELAERHGLMRFDTSADGLRRAVWLAAGEPVDTATISGLSEHLYAVSTSENGLDSVLRAKQLEGGGAAGNRHGWRATSGRPRQPAQPFGLR